MPLLRHRFLPLALLLSALPGVAQAQQTVGELYASDASVKGSVILADSGTSVISGSAIQAGARAATLKLDRGGSLLVCPGTNLSVTASQNGRALLYSVNSGNLELDYPLGASADSLLTPDFRLVMPGPGRLHAAVRISGQGDTCVQTLASNSTAITVYETMGDETYQVKNDEAVLFQGGHIKGVLPSHQNCGCPLPPKTEVARATPPPPPPVEPKPIAKAAAIVPSPDEHVTVDAPFIFRGNEANPDLTENVMTLKLESNHLIQLDPVVLPPNTKNVHSEKKNEVASQTDQKHGFFARMGAFIASIFH